MAIRKIQKTGRIAYIISLIHRKLRAIRNASVKGGKGLLRCHCEEALSKSKGRRNNLITLISDCFASLAMTVAKSFRPFTEALRAIPPNHGGIILAFLFPPLVILTTLTEAKAEIYTFVDENGTVHFTNVPTDPQYKMIIPPKEEKEEVNRNDRGVELDRLIQETSYKYGLDPALIKAVIAVESDFNPSAVSEKGARGLMQLMPVTANELGVSNSFDPVDNVDGGTRYLRYLLDYFNWDIDLALAAYHAGASRVEKYFGIPPIPATHYYVNKVKSTYRKYILQ